MGEINERPDVKTIRQNKGPILELLREQNPQTAQEVLIMYTDAFCDYVEAQENIDRNGAIVFHPRTGAPIENPYLKIRNAAGAQLRAMFVQADKLWEKHRLTPG